MRAIRHTLTAVLAAALVAGCGGQAAPVNVEATVQARVSATVAAFARAQPTATRPPPVTTVIPVGGPALSPAPNVSGVGTPFATAGTAAPATTTTPGATPSGAAGTATPLRSPTPGGTPAATGTPAGTPATTLAFGAVAPVGGLQVTINRYEWNTNCPAGGARAANGGKFVVVQAIGRNDGSSAVTPSPSQWAIENVPAGSSVPCRPEGRPFDEVCYRSGPIAAGGRCEGWVLFEVPEQLEIPGATVSVRAVGSATEAGRWRLPA